MTFPTQAEMDRIEAEFTDKMWTAKDCAEKSLAANTAFDGWKAGGSDVPGDLRSYLRYEDRLFIQDVQKGRQPHPSYRNVLTVKQLEEQVLESHGLEELVTGMLPMRSVNILGGDSGLGKSPLLCQLAVCVAAGIPFLGHSVKKSPVLIADYENDASLLGMLHNVAEAVKAPETDSLFILQRPEKPELYRAVNYKDARLVIIDSLRGFDSAAEQNKNGAAGRMISELQDVDACWLPMHHLRKPGNDAVIPALEDDVAVLTWLEQLAGSRSLINQTFTRMAVAVPKRVQAELVLRGFFKGRGEFGPLYLDRIYNDAGDPIGYTRLSGAAILPPNRKADLQKIVAAGTSHTFASLVELLGSRGSASRFLNACRSTGLIKETKVGRGKLFEFQTEPKP